ncbi:MAG: glycosyltransferase family 39 protein [Cyanobacteria bacterium J06623_7]
MNKSGRSQLWNRDSLWVICLLLAALILYTAGLGDLPLRDWDEGIVAGVARNIYRAEPGTQTWLYPTINYGDPYWNKPPLIHSAIALSYRLFGISEWSTRLPPAIISAVSVPLVYLIARELCFSLPAAVLSGAVHLTLLPVVRHGRVAMLDGAISCWFCLGVWCLLRSRQGSGWLWTTGIALGLICLTKGIMIGVLLGGILIIFLAWDDFKRLQTGYFWGCLVLGVLPAIAWYLLQYQHYGAAFLGISLGDQTFERIWTPVSNLAAPPWYYLLEIAKYGFPWLIFLPYGLKLAVRNRLQSWSKLTLTWVIVYLLAISLMETKLPWYVIPIYPALALLVGNALGRIWHRKETSYWWQIFFSLIAVVCWLGSLYYGAIDAEPQPDLAIIILVAAISFTIAGVLLWRRSHNFIGVTIVGFYLALLLLFNTSHWLWELNNSYPVKPIAIMVRKYTPPGQKIYTNHPHGRPSLEFYSDRVVENQANRQLEQLWQNSEGMSIYVLIDPASPPLELQNRHVVAQSQSWQLVTNRSELVR